MKSLRATAVDIETEWNLKTHSPDGKNTYYR